MSAGPEQIAEAVARLRSGGIVAFPTETVYGLGAGAFDAAAVRRVFELKGRPGPNPLIVHVADEAMARTVTSEWPPDAHRLALAFWPGPLTIVVPKSPALPDVVTGGGPTVGVRCPDHHVTLALLEALGSPLVGPSANPSGRVSPTTGAHVRASFTPEQVYVLDGGPCRAGIESTVVALSPVARILRPGVIGADEISRVLGRDVRLEPPPSSPADALESPGRLATHYAPRTPAIVFDSVDLQRVLDGSSGPVAVLSCSCPELPDPHILIPMPAGAPAYAARLYAALREADEVGAALIAIQRPPGPTAPEDPIWNAVADRLSRAARPWTR